MSSQPQDQKSQQSAPPSDPIDPPTTNANDPTTLKPTTDNPRLTALQAQKEALTQSLAERKSARHALATATATKLPSDLPLATSTPTGEPLSEEDFLAAALKSSNAVIKEHIALLHKYNEIKDIGQGLMGLIADKRDCRVVVVMEEFGIGEGD